MASFMDILQGVGNTAYQFTGIPTLMDAAAESMARTVKLDKYGKPLNEMDTGLMSVYTDPDYLRKSAQNTAMLAASAGSGGTARAGFQGFKAAMGTRTAAGMSPGVAGISSVPSAFRSGLGYFTNRAKDVVKAPTIRGKFGAALETLGSVYTPPAFAFATAMNMPGAGGVQPTPASQGTVTLTGSNPAEGLASATEALKRGEITQEQWNTMKNNFEEQFKNDYLRNRVAGPAGSGSGGGGSSAATDAYKLQSNQVKESLRDAIMGIRQEVSGGSADLATTLAGLGMSQSPAQLDVGLESIQQQGVTAEQQTRMQARQKLTELLAQLTQQRQAEANARFNAEQAARYNDRLGGLA